MDNFPLWALVTMAIFFDSIMTAKWLDTINGRRRRKWRTTTPSASATPITVASSTAINRSLIVPAFKGLSEQQGKDERCATDRNLTAIRTQLSHGRNPERRLSARVLSQ